MDPAEASAPSKKSPVLAIVIILVVLAALAVAYFVFFAKKSGTSIVNKIVPISSSCKYNDPDLCKFINGWKEIKYFSATTTSTFEGKEVKMTMKSVGSDKTQLTSYQGDNEDMNIVTIGNDTYTKDYTDGKWVKSTITPQSDSSANTIKDELQFNQKAEKAEDKTEYKKIGTEACGKLTCFKYQVIDPAITDSTEYILFDNKDYQLRKTISVDKSNNQSISEFSYSKISIDVPSPIKEEAAISAPASPSQEEIDKAINQIQSGSTDSSDTGGESSNTGE
ncbi:MAG: hypothetical protein NTZ65_02485 [Candidatus Berkelbacteria bacterium]|nr:hypothetical protein [Candidatus Berkelbacteria bacterium]